MMNKKLLFVLMLSLLLMPFVLADVAQLNTTVNPEDKAKFDTILTPVTKIYNFVRYIASAVALLMLLYAGISFMLSGNDAKQKDQSKTMIMYVVVGLLVIWAAPLIVELLIT